MCIIVYMHLRKKIRTILDDTSRSFARTPRKFALKDWKNALSQTRSAIHSKRIGILAAGIAYFLTFAVFPAIAAGVAILSFVISKPQFNNVVTVIENVLPNDLANLIISQLESALVSPSSSALIVIFGIVISLVSLSGAMTNIMNASNAIYEVDETRKKARVRVIGLGFIAAGAVITIIVLGLLILQDSYLESIGISPLFSDIIIAVRWLVITVLVTFGLAYFYRYAPNRQNPHWQWVTWGSCIATLIWLAGTILFFIYARYLADYTEAYSVFAGIIILMIWLNLTAFAVLLGAEINFRLENQTRARTTA